jgi:hypothetical protein
MSLPLSGNIQAVPLPALLQDLQQKKATGGLTIRRDGVEKCVYVKGGQIVFATSTEAADRLGEMLVKAGLLSREHLDTAVGIYQKNAGTKKIGAILVENGFVAPKNLFTGLRAQVKEILYSLFLWDEAEYRFEERLPPDIIQLQFDVPELIAEFIERMKREA